MKTTSVPKIEIPIGCACSLKVFYICVFAAVAAAVTFAPVDLWLKGLLLGLSAVAAIPAIKQVNLLEDLEFIRVKDEGLELRFKDKKVPVRLVGNGVVSQLLVTFSCEDEENKRWWSRPMHFVIFPDATSPEHHRLLRLLVRNGV